MNSLKGFLIILTLSFFQAGNAAESLYYRLYPDSIYNYSFNSENNQYVLASINFYHYKNGLLDSIIVTSADRVFVSKTVNYYSEGVLRTIRNFIFRNGSWEPSQNQESYYDEQGRLSVRVVTRWRTDHWENLNTFTYIYDDYERLSVYHRDFWANNMWNDFSNDSLFYDSEGYLTERSARLSSTGNYITRILYSYDNNGLKISQTRQDFLSPLWINAARTSYFYNSCGTQDTTMGDKWSRVTWEQDSRSVVYYHYEIFPGVYKVPVCHNGKTVFVHAKDLKKFLALGDCLGECINPVYKSASYRKSATSTKNSHIPFIVFPNPADDHITLRISDDNCPVVRMDLVDYYGRILKSFETNGEELLTIDISSLESGNYILRVVADSVYSLVITKR